MGGIEDSFSKKDTTGPEHADKVQVMAEAGKSSRDYAHKLRMWAGRGRHHIGRDEYKLHEEKADYKENVAGIIYDVDKSAEKMTDVEISNEIQRLKAELSVIITRMGSRDVTDEQIDPEGKFEVLDIQIKRFTEIGNARLS